MGIGAAAPQWAAQGATWKMPAQGAALHTEASGASLNQLSGRRRVGGTSKNGMGDLQGWDGGLQGWDGGIDRDGAVLWLH